MCGAATWRRLRPRPSRQTRGGHGAQAAGTALRQAGVPNFREGWGGGRCAQIDQSPVAAEDVAPPAGAMQTFERPLRDSERRWLRLATERPRVAGRALARATIVSGIVVFGLLAALTVAVARADWRVALAVWVLVGVCIGLWTYFQERWRLARSVRRFVRALRRNKARVTQIQSSEVAEIEAQDDEGQTYAFQLPERRIVFVVGQDFYESPRFPNSDFSIIEILGDSNEVVGIHIDKRGETLVPARKISPARVRRMSWPKHLQVVDGSLNELEQLLTNLPDS